MPPTYDILGLGVVAVDDLLYVGSWPPADAKTRVARRDRQCGGLTGTALVAAARLGARCAYAGTLGSDELSAFVTSTFEREGIDTSHVVRRADARPVHSTIVVDETHHTRNIFFSVGGAAGADLAAPDDEVLRSTKVLFVDQYGIEGMLRAASIVRDAGGAVVADFEHGDLPRFGELLAQVNHLIVSAAFAREITELSDPVAAVKALWFKGSDTVAVTCGVDGAWYLSKDNPAEPRHQPAFIVDTVDTTGCGDVFHGAYASALARGLAVEDRIRLGSAAAAIKSTQPGGQKGIPTLPVVEKFLAEKKGQGAF
jgi:sugar/nucleoside kinase (ribokinase family)